MKAELVGFLAALVLALLWQWVSARIRNERDHRELEREMADRFVTRREWEQCGAVSSERVEAVHQRLDQMERANREEHRDISRTLQELRDLIASANGRRHG